MKDLSEFNFLSIEPSKFGKGYTVYGYGEYPDHSVLAGQTMKQFLDGFDTIEEAKCAYPDADPDAGYSPVSSLSHLPGEDDPVPGGMYPDDYDDGY